MMEDSLQGSENLYSMAVQQVGGLLELMTSIDAQNIALLGSPSFIDHGAGLAKAFHRQ